jgi:hypothetical protein
MQKSYTISCCAECPVCRFRKDREAYCEKQGWLIEEDSGNPVNIVLIGFPEWCPLPDVEIVGDSLSVELKKIARQILKRLDLDLDDDSVILISHYLSTVVDIKGFKGAKEKAKAEGNDLFSLPASQQL